MTVSNSDNRDRGDWGADPELRQLVQASDPAHSLPPLSPQAIARLAATAYAGGSSRTRGARHRSWVPAVVAAAVLLVAGLGSVAAVLTGGSSQAPLAAEQPVVTRPAPVATTPAPAPIVSKTPPARTRLVVPDAPDFKCAVPTADLLRLQQLAFEGVVTSLEGSVATLQVTTVFAGDVTDTAQVQVPSTDTALLLSAVTFEVGKTYLVSATDGQVSVCGFSAESTPDLRAVYVEAFGG